MIQRAFIVFIPRSFYTQHAFTHSKHVHTASFYTQKFLICTHKLLHIANLYTEKLLHKASLHSEDFKQSKLLHREAFPHSRLSHTASIYTHKIFCTQKLWPAEGSSLNILRFSTQQLLRTNDPKLGVNILTAMLQFVHSI